MLANTEMRVAGIDVGALTAKTVILNNGSQIIAYSILPIGASSIKAAQASFDRALHSADLEMGDVCYIIGTGYGRQIVPFANSQVTEITCHGRGAYSIFPNVRTIIDIGGQDSKVIRVDDNGKLMKFLMNDKCAAGSGRFLEMMAQALEVALNDMGELSLRSQKEVSVSSTCSVYAETEVVSLVTTGHNREDILAAIHRAIAKRMVTMVERLGVEERVAMTGGVAKNIGVVRAIEDLLGTSLLIPEEPQIVGALGAALIARERCRQASMVT